jgi:sialic acid synthase SpsE
MLNNLGVKAFKIASTDNDNFQLLKKIIDFKKPIIISTAMTSQDEVREIVQFFKKNKFKKYIILQCTGSYPSKISDANLRVIQNYKNSFKCLVGYSDHTTDNLSAIASIGFGAKVIEKHFTLDKKMWGPDHRMSLSPLELEKSINEIRLVEKSLGKDKKEILLSEKDNRKKLKKSLVFAKDMKKNEKVKLSHIKIKRPGTGIRPIFIKKIIGLKLKKNVKENYLIKFGILKK